MTRWGIAAAAVVLLGLTGPVQAQVPTGGNGMRFVPIDTSRNLATPLPVGNIPQLKKSSLERFFEAVEKALPFFGKTRRAPLTGPMAPTTKLPPLPAPELPGPLLPRTTLPSGQ